MAMRYAISPSARVYSVRFFLGGEMRPMRLIVWNSAWQELYSQTLTPNVPSGSGGLREITKARNSLWIKRSTMRRKKAPYIFAR